jgi:isopropylmalate/homocitrate/citramalate synthase
MYQSDHAQRMDWIETVNEVEKLGVKTIIAGHTDPEAPDNDAARLIEAAGSTSTTSTRRSRRVAAARRSSRR